MDVMYILNSLGVNIVGRYFAVQTHDCDGLVEYIELFAR